MDSEMPFNLRDNFEEMNGNGMADGIDSYSQSTWMPKEETVNEDVLEIAADKSLVEDLEPAAVESKSSRDRDADRKKIAVKKERSKEKDDKDRDKQKDRVFICTIRSLIKRSLTIKILGILQTLHEKEKVPPLPHSRWEDHSYSEGECTDQSDIKQSLEGGGADMTKRAENAIFRRAISAIKPKNSIIEIKLRPERRILLEANATELDGSGNLDFPMTEGLKNPSPPEQPVVSMRVALSSAPKLHINDTKTELDDKKKSVRDRLGDKIQPDQVQAKSGEVDKEKEREKSIKKERRSSPNAGKDKVIDCIIAIPYRLRYTLFDRD